MKPIQLHLGDRRSSVSFTDPDSLFASFPSDNCLVVTDSNCRSLFPPSVTPSVVLPAGESSKQFASVQTILQAALTAGLDRHSLFIAVGGGVVCDLTAFAASIYQRGARLSLCPTDLLAMVDAAVGGKTGIDFGNYKNQIGTFFPAETVWMVPEFLAGLPQEEWLNGLGEVIKSALLRDPKLLSLLIRRKEAVLHRDLSVVRTLIRRSLAVKSYFVSHDFKERGIRAFLNLGHTFAHALESVDRFRGIPHGRAVAWGLYKAAQLSSLVLPSDPSYLPQVTHLLRLYDYRLNFTDKDPNALLEAMSRDKKKQGGALYFVLQKGVGKTVIRPVDPAVVLQVLQTP